MEHTHTRDQMHVVAPTNSRSSTPLVLDELLVVSNRQPYRHSDADGVVRSHDRDDSARVDASRGRVGVGTVGINTTGVEGSRVGAAFDPANTGNADNNLSESSSGVRGAGGMVAGNAMNSANYAADGIDTNRGTDIGPDGATYEGSVDQPTGGLTASLDPLLQRTGGTWIAWGDGAADEAVVDGHDRVGVPPGSPRYTLRRIWLSDEQVEKYYLGFSNRVLWPICHAALATVDSDVSFWETYYETNQQFANTIVEEAGPQQVIWLQDYHLALAPWLVRLELGAAATIMHFWHVPWPTWDVFRACPHRAELLRGLLGNDLIGFHVGRYVHNFLECVEAALDDAVVDWAGETVSYRGMTTRAVAIPMGVPVDEIAGLAASYEGSDFIAFRRRHGIGPSTSIAVGVDRLDYSKGIPERLQALEALWERSPEWRESLTYVQNGSESRSEIDAYQRIQTEVEEAIQRINDRFGTDSWQPIVSVDEHLDRQELYGLYRHSDLAIVSPLRDGMNLVAEEYAAAQVDSDGVLVLSDQTGAHDLIGEAAVSITPYNIEQFADGIDRALRMPPAERRSRMNRIRQIVAANDLEQWFQRHAAELEAIRYGRVESSPASPQ